MPVKQPYILKHQAYLMLARLPARPLTRFNMELITSPTPPPFRHFCSEEIKDGFSQVNGLPDVEKMLTPPYLTLSCFLPPSHHALLREVCGRIEWKQERMTSSKKLLPLEPSIKLVSEQPLHISMSNKLCCKSETVQIPI